MPYADGRDHPSTRSLRALCRPRNPCPCAHPICPVQELPCTAKTPRHATCARHPCPQGELTSDPSGHHPSHPSPAQTLPRLGRVLGGPLPASRPSRPGRRVHTALSTRAPLCASGRCLARNGLDGLLPSCPASRQQPEPKHTLCSSRNS